MTLSVLQLLSVVFVPVLLGAALLRLQGVVPRTDPLAYLGWSWLQGCLGVAVMLSLSLWLRLPMSAAWLSPVLLACAGTACFLGRGVPVVERGPREDHPRWERLCFAVVVGLLLVSTVDRILLASADVLVGSDEALIWAAKAKVMFHTGGFGTEFLEGMQTHVLISHPYYPPLNPLLQLWVHVHAGEIVHVESRLPMQVFGLAGILVAASALRRRARPLVAAAFLVLVGTLGRFFTYQAFSDALIAISLLTCWDLWQRFQEDGELHWLRMLGASATVLVWSKDEGQLHVLVFALAVLVAVMARRVRLPEHRDRLRCLAWATPLLVSILYIHWFNRHFGLVSYLLEESAHVVDPTAAQGDPRFLGFSLRNVGHNALPILEDFAARIASPTGPARGLLGLFLVVLVLSPRSAGEGRRLVFTLGLVLALLGYMSVYLVTPWEVKEQLKHSAHRLVYQLAPAAGLWVLLFVVGALPRLSGSRTRA